MFSPPELGPEITSVYSTSGAPLVVEIGPEEVPDPEPLVEPEPLPDPELPDVPELAELPEVPEVPEFAEVPELVGLVGLTPVEPVLPAVAALFASTVLGLDALALAGADWESTPPHALSVSPVSATPVAITHRQRLHTNFKVKNSPAT